MHVHLNGREESGHPMIIRSLWWWLIPLLWLVACQPASRPGTSLSAAPAGPHADPEAVAYLLAAKKAERENNRVEAAAMWEAAARADTTSPTLMLGLARAMLALNRDSAALVSAKASIRLDSTFVDGHRFLADYYRDSNDLNRSAFHLEAILRHSSDDEAGWQLVHLYNGLNRQEDTRRVMERMANGPQSTPTDLLEWANAADNMGLKASAEMFYRTALRRWPGLESGVVAYAVFLDKYGRTAEAEAVFRDGLARWPNSSEIRQKLVWLLLGQERWTAADSVMAGMSVRSRDDLDERKAWVSLLLKRGQAELAIADLERLAMQFPDDADFYLLLGQAHTIRGDFRQAAVAFGQAAARDSSVQAFIGLIYSQTQARQFAEAERSAHAAVRTFPGDTRLRYMLGVALRAQERWAEASEVFGQVAREDSTNAAYLFDWGSSLERAGKFEQAVAALRRVLARNPHDASTLNYLGYMYAERGTNLDEALRMITQAVAQEPKNAAYLDSMGWVLYRLRRYAEAKRHLLEAIQYEQQSAVIYEHLGDVSDALGQRNEARTYWQQALRLDPGNSEVQAKLDKLPGE